MHIRRQHDLGIGEAKRRVDKVAADISGQFSLRSHWQGDTLNFNGSGVKGAVLVAENSIEFDVDLGFALMMMEAPIRSAITQALDKQLDA